jgi:catechol 2,3-dioxygenase-like lactoylglutathione lyase family enzyme
VSAEDPSPVGGGSEEPPPLVGVLETALYYEPGRREEMESLYRDVLGLKVVAKWSDGTALRIGGGVLLLFDRELLAMRDEPPADHGSRGPDHVCLLAPEGAYETWNARLSDHGFEIVHEATWGEGTRSFYFRDPAGNLLEIAEGDIWG